MTISHLGSRVSGFARQALAAATRGKQRADARNQKLPSPPMALASIIRPQVRERWLLPQVAAITPTYIEMTLRGALAGAHGPQWELFNLMEDTWPRLRKNVLELKMAVGSRRAVFEAYRDEEEVESATATERMKLVSAALRTMQPDPSVDEGAFDEMVGDILDAWFKGVSVLEVDWQVAQTRGLGRFVGPRAVRWVSPVSYGWDGDWRVVVAEMEDGKSRMEKGGGLAAFPADRFIVAKCKTKSGSVLGGALLRPLVWWWCAANFSADWLLNFAQVFGLPLRWATYDPSAPQETVDALCAMLQKMGSAGWGAFPNGTALEVKAEGQRSGRETPQGDLLDRADKQCDLLVLGQTLTTDTGGMGHGGGSHALGRVHADVRGGIIDAAAKFAAGVIEQQLIPSILRLNYGDAEEAPTLTFQERTEDDLTARAQWIATLAGAGAGGIIPLDWLGKSFGIPKPEAGEATLAGKAGTSLSTVPFAAANFNPDQPRAIDGKWTSSFGSSHAPTNRGRKPGQHSNHDRRRLTQAAGGSARPNGALGEPGAPSAPASSPGWLQAVESFKKLSRQYQFDEEIAKYQTRYAATKTQSEKDALYNEFTAGVDQLAAVAAFFGPEAVYKIIAMQAKIAEGSVQANLLRRWLLLSAPDRDVYIPSPQEVTVIDPRFSLLKDDAFLKDLRAKTFTDTPQQFTREYDVPGAAMSSSTIGHYVAQVKATTEYCNTSIGEWYKATGTFRILDIYDFDVKEEVVRQAFDSLMRKEPAIEQKFQGRTNIAELKTYIMNRLGTKVPHKDFDVLIKGRFEESNKSENPWATIQVGQ